MIGYHIRSTLDAERLANTPFGRHREGGGQRHESTIWRGRLLVSRRVRFVFLMIVGSARKRHKNCRFARRRHLQTIILLLVTNDDHPVTPEKIAARDRSLRSCGRRRGGLPISFVRLIPHCFPAISKQTPYPYFK